jgi:hypothetical protein
VFDRGVSSRYVVRLHPLALSDDKSVLTWKGTTPEPTPPENPAVEPTPTPGKIRRTLSLTRSNSERRPGGSIFRRLSLRGGPPPTKEFNLGGDSVQRRVSISGPHPMPTEADRSYFPPGEPQRPGPLLRRPTNLSQRSRINKRRPPTEGDDGAGALVNLEGGLMVTLNVEVSAGDPAGITVPYRLLVPALWHDGGYEPNATRVVKGWRKWLGRGPKKPTETPPVDYQEDRAIEHHDPDHPHEIEHPHEDEDEHQHEDEHPHEDEPDHEEYRSSDEEDVAPGRVRDEDHQKHHQEHQPDTDADPDAGPSASRAADHSPPQQATYDDLSDDEDDPDDELFGPPPPQPRRKKWLDLI